VEQALGAGRDTVFDIDWQGHRQLRTALPGDVVASSS
jgi:guanylate kinase